MTKPSFQRLKKWSKNTQNLEETQGWDSRLQNCKRGLFGTEVMKQCTPIGSRDKPGLPAAELRELKKAIFTQFPQFWKCPVEFESTWKKCLEAIQQSCKRLRLNNNFIFHLKTCILLFIMHTPCIINVTLSSTSRHNYVSFCLSCIHHVLLMYLLVSNCSNPYYIALYTSSSQSLRLESLCGQMILYTKF